MPFYLFFYLELGILKINCRLIGDGWQALDLNHKYTRHRLGALFLPRSKVQSLNNKLLRKIKNLIYLILY